MTIRSFTLKIVAKIKYTIFNSFLFSGADEICYNSLTDSDGMNENRNDSLIFSGANEICYNSLTDSDGTNENGNDSLIYTGVGEIWYSSLTDLFSIDSVGTNEN